MSAESRGGIALALERICWREARASRNIYRMNRIDCTRATHEQHTRCTDEKARLLTGKKAEHGRRWVCAEVKSRPAGGKVYSGSCRNRLHVVPGACGVAVGFHSIQCKRYNSEQEQRYKYPSGWKNAKFVNVFAGSGF